MDVVLTINRDGDLECPNSRDCDWKLYSFCKRHVNYRDPEGLGLRLADRNSPGAVTDKRLQRMLRGGLAFWAYYVEHGPCEWGLADDPPAGADFLWDGVRYAGILVWEEDEHDLGPRAYADRKEDAARFCRIYTDWCNGDGYRYQVDADVRCGSCGREQQGRTVDGAGGFYGTEADAMLEEIQAAVKRYRLVAVRGDAAALWTDRFGKPQAPPPPAADDGTRTVRVTYSVRYGTDVRIPKDAAVPDAVERIANAVAPPQDNNNDFDGDVDVLTVTDTDGKEYYFD